MRWLIRTLAVLTVVSWIVIAGLFARPMPNGPWEGASPMPPASPARREPPADWSKHLLAGERDAFPGVTRAQAQQVVAIVDRHARRFGLDPILVLAVIQVESGFDPAAISSQGAMGLMQLQAETARELAEDLGVPWTGDDMLFDADRNVLLGCAYLSRLVDRFGNLDAALAAYSAGPTFVEARQNLNGRIPLAYTDRVWDALVALQAKASA